MINNSKMGKINSGGFYITHKHDEFNLLIIRINVNKNCTGYYLLLIEFLLAVSERINKYNIVLLFVIFQYSSVLPLSYPPLNFLCVCNISSPLLLSIWCPLTLKHLFLMSIFNFILCLFPSFSQNSL